MGKNKRGRKIYKEQEQKNNTQEHLGIRWFNNPWIGRHFFLDPFVNCATNHAHLYNF